MILIAFGYYNRIDSSMKICSKCKEQKPFSEFSKDKHHVTGYSSSCKPCRRTKYSKKKYDDNKAYFLEKSKEYRENKIPQRRVLSWKLKLILERGGKCECCGYDKCLAALEFHHKDPNGKDFTIKAEKINSKSWDRCLEEASKCLLLCANCHREHHHLSNQEELVELILEDFNDYNTGLTKEDYEKYRG